MIAERPFMFPSYFALASTLERRGGDLISLSRKITTVGAVSKTIGQELEDARQAALAAAAAIEKYQRGEASDEAALDQAVGA